MATATTSGPSLLTRIQDFSLSDPLAEVSFESKLAAQSGWTLGHAHLVSDEYRRFVYLTQSAGQPMCPSHDVDLAWHLHLTQTRSYRLFCENVLGRFLHHDASAGGAAELARHTAMYRATLEAYRSTFGEPPPQEIWPAVEVRFGNGAAVKQTDAAWQLPEVLKLGRTSQAAVVVTAGCIAWALNVILGDPLWNRVPGIPFGLAYVLAMVGVGVVFTADRRHRTARVTGAPVVDAHEAAWLAGGHERVVGTAVAGLIDRGLLDLSPEKNDDKITGAHCRRSSKDVDIGKLDRVERACLEGVRDGDLDFDRLRSTTAVVLSAIPHRLEKAGLVLRAGEMDRFRAVTAMLMFALLVIGFSRFGHVFSEGRWFPSLLATFICLNLILLFRLIAAPGQPSMLGLKALADMQARHSDLKEGHSAGGLALAPRYAGSASLVILAFALFGTQAVMASEAFAGINFVFGEDKTNATGNSGSTAGCGGDGGCGGCGGCG